MAVCDVSFISLKRIIDKIASENVKLDMVCLIKPQFECGKEISDMYKGIPLNKEVHKEVIEKVLESFSDIGYNIQNITYSPITGGSGNIEYLGYFKKDNKKEINIDNVINEAFKELK